MDADAPASPEPDPTADDVRTTAPDAVATESRGAITEPAPPPLDLDAISSDLDGVETALTRLGDGTYWIDEVTGEPLPDDLLAASPTARRA